MNQNEIRGLLQQFRQGMITEDDVLLKLREAPFEDLGYAKLDTHRALRQGAAEVIYGAGKTPEQIAGIAAAARKAGQKVVLITRMSQEAADYVQAQEAADAAHLQEANLQETTNFMQAPDTATHADLLSYDPISRTGIIGALPAPDGKGTIAVVTGGTSDMPVAEEAARTAEVYGNKVIRIYDVGVAGIHRLFAHLDDLMSARVVISIAGMEGALTSVVGGLVNVPVIAVPTSVGYGASFHGLSALLSMLNSCASGVSVVNIDNGFGAGYQASMINHL